MVERLYPGVYVTETATNVHPIDGVSTSATTPASLHTAERVSRPSDPAPPDWTLQAPHDPGVTLVQLLAFLGESLLFRSAGGPIESMVHAQPGYGVAQGLAVDSRGAGDTAVHVSPGQVTTPEGQPVDTESTTPHRHRIEKP